MKLTTSQHLVSSTVDCQEWMKLPLALQKGGLKESFQDQFSVVLHTDQGHSEILFNRAVQELFTYHIYPPWRVRSTICGSNGKIEKGVVIVQKILFGPLGIEAAVRVVDVFDIQDGQVRRVGFTYATLRGHPERGMAKFEVSCCQVSGQISFSILTRSSPGNWLVALFHPLIRLIQRHSNRTALEYFKKPARS